MDINHLEKILGLCNSEQLMGVLHTLPVDEASFECALKRASQLLGPKDIKQAMFHGNFDTKMREMIRSRQWGQIEHWRQVFIKASPEAAQGQSRASFNDWVLRDLIDERCVASEYDHALGWKQGDSVSDVYALCTSNPPFASLDR